MMMSKNESNPENIRRRRSRKLADSLRTTRTWTRTAGLLGCETSSRLKIEQHRCDLRPLLVGKGDSSRVCELMMETIGCKNVAYETWRWLISGARIIAMRQLKNFEDKLLLLFS